MTAKRNNKRLRIADYVASAAPTTTDCFQVFNVGDNQYVGDLADISSGGMMMISEQPIKPDTVLDLRVTLPHETAGKEYLTFKARNIWWLQDEHQGHCRNGFKIESISPDQAEIIDLLFDEMERLTAGTKNPVSSK